MPTRAIIKSIEPILKTVGDDRELAAIATAVRACQVKAVESVIEMGRLLEDAQRRLSRHHQGVFGKWLDTECHLSKTSARRAMQAFKQFGKVSRAKVARLEISAMYALSTPSCPPKARAAAIKVVAGGGSISHQVARTLVARYTPKANREEPTALELIDSIRKAMRVIYENAPEELRCIVAPKFRDFANELERTGDLSW